MNPRIFKEWSPNEKANGNIFKPFLRLTDRFVLLTGVLTSPQHASMMSKERLLQSSNDGVLGCEFEELDTVVLFDVGYGCINAIL